MSSRRRIFLLTCLASVACTSASAAPAIKYAGPIVITRGGTYRGNWQSLNPNTPAVTIKTKEPVVIEYSNIQSRGKLIYSAFKRANLTVRFTRGVAMNPNRPLKEHRSPGRFVHLEAFESARIENNELVGTSGMYFRDWQGQVSKGQTIKVMYNKARNIDGRYSVGVERYSPDKAAFVQFVQFNDVKRIAGVEIAWNEIVNEPGKSRPEENVNMYKSSGRPESRIKIHDNYIQGAYPGRPTIGEYGGGGMNLADGNSKTLAEASAFVMAYRNTIIGTSNEGIALSAGHDIEAFHNRVISSGYLPDGRPIASQNVGIYVWDSYKNKPYGTFYNNFAHDNLVSWARPLDGPKANNPVWFPDCAKDARGRSRCTGNRGLGERVTLSVEAREYRRWQAKVQGARVALGIPGRTREAQGSGAAAPLGSVQANSVQANSVQANSVQASGASSGTP